MQYWELYLTLLIEVKGKQGAIAATQLKTRFLKYEVFS